MNAFEIIEDFISKRELTCPTEFRAWQTLKTDVLAQQANNKQSAPLCEFYGCSNLATELRCEKHFGLVN